MCGKADMDDKGDKDDRDANKKKMIEWMRQGGG